MENDEPDVISVAALDDGDTERRSARRSLKNVGLAVTILVSMVALSLGVGALMAPRDEGSHPGTTDGDPLLTPAGRAVLAALDASTSTGGYEVTYEFVIEPPANDEARCPEGGIYVPDGSSAPAVEPCPPFPALTVTGHGVVHLNPYYLEAVSNLSNLGEITVRTDGDRIVEEGGANFGGSLEDGEPLSGFAGLVESTFGAGPGALTMLALANPTGYLSLTANTVTDVAPAGTGEVDGVPVTFYDVTSDPTAMSDLPGLTSEQQATIDDALAVLDRTGFSATATRIAVDGDGYIRESISDASFADGTTMDRHMVLSRFGCLGTGPTPANPTGTPEDLPPECASPSTTTAVAPLSSTTVETTTSSSTAPSTTATVALTTSATAGTPTTETPTTVAVTIGAPETTTTVAVTVGAQETTTTSSNQG